MTERASDGPLVSVVLPTFNERDNVVPLVGAILDALAGYRVEVLVVDDSSPDGTADAVRARYAADPAVRTIVRTADPGFAKSIRTGIEEARGDVIVVMDSDFNHQPRYLPFMVDALRHYDGVMGSRFLYGGRMFPRARHLLSWLFNVFVRVATWGQITDSLYGLFAIHARHLRHVDRDAIFFGRGEYFIRLVVAWQRQGLSILQFPAVNGRRLAGAGNSRFVRTFATYFGATVRLVWSRGKLAHVHGSPSVPDLREPAPGTAPPTGVAGPHRGLPAGPGHDRPGRAA